VTERVRRQDVASEGVLGGCEEWPVGVDANPELPPALFRYRPEVMDALAPLGLRPTGRTRPETIRAQLNDLYRWELRRLRDQLLARRFSKAEYATRVIAVRRRYPLLSIPMDAWLVPPSR
jgi:hypothetical protein